jgi:hypothetical protein
MKVRSFRSEDPLHKGVDLHVVDETTVAMFAGYVVGSNQSPGGEMKLTLGVPFAQVPNVMPVMQHVGGIQFEVTFRRVPFDELPEPGW